MAERTAGTDPQTISRRDALRRTAIVGGAVWAAPAVLSFAPSAGAAGSPAPCPQGLWGFKLQNDGTCVLPPNGGSQACLGGSYADTLRCDDIGGTGGAMTPSWTVTIPGPLTEACLRCGGNGVTQLRFTNSGSGDFGPGTGTYTVSGDRKTITVTCTLDNGSPRNVGHLEVIYSC
jgi:hypothetical protein